MAGSDASAEGSVGGHRKNAAEAQDDEDDVEHDAPTSVFRAAMH